MARTPIFGLECTHGYTHCWCQCFLVLNVFCETKVVGHVFRAAKLRSQTQTRVTYSVIKHPFSNCIALLFAEPAGSDHATTVL